MSYRYKNSYKSYNNNQSNQTQQPMDEDDNDYPISPSQQQDYLEEEGEEQEISDISDNDSEISNNEEEEDIGIDWLINLLQINLNQFQESEDEDPETPISNSEKSILDSLANINAEYAKPIKKKYKYTKKIKKIYKLASEKLPHRNLVLSHYSIFNSLKCKYHIYRTSLTNYYKCNISVDPHLFSLPPSPHPVLNTYQKHEEQEDLKKFIPKLPYILTIKEFEENKQSRIPNLPKKQKHNNNEYQGFSDAEREPTEDNEKVVTMPVGTPIPLLLLQKKLLVNNKDETSTVNNPPTSSFLLDSKLLDSLIPETSTPPIIESSNNGNRGNISNNINNNNNNIGNNNFNQYNGNNMYNNMNNMNSFNSTQIQQMIQNNMNGNFYNQQPQLNRERDQDNSDMYNNNNNNNLIYNQNQNQNNQLMNNNNNSQKILNSLQIAAKDPIIFEKVKLLMASQKQKELQLLNRRNELINQLRDRKKRKEEEIETSNSTFNNSSIPNNTAKSLAKQQQLQEKLTKEITQFNRQLKNELTENLKLIESEMSTMIFQQQLSLQSLGIVGFFPTNDTKQIELQQNILFCLFPTLFQ